MGKLINIIKATGEVEPFSEEKVIGSLKRAGASKELAERIVSQIKPNLYQNIPSFQIYSTVMKILRKEKRDLAEKYNLKRAIFDLGPTGYPFEKFVAEVLKKNDYMSETNKVILGKCVSHEIDIVALENKNNKKRYMVECKFHNQLGGRTDIKVALYTYARFLDVKTKDFDAPWLITNTKVTTEVKAYAECVGMKIVSWDYPIGESLRELIDRSGLYPVTALTSLSAKQKQSLIDKGIVFSRDFNSPSLLKN